MFLKVFSSSLKGFFFNKWAHKKSVQESKKMKSKFDILMEELESSTKFSEKPVSENTKISISYVPQKHNRDVVPTMSRVERR